MLPNRIGRLLFKSKINPSKGLQMQNLMQRREYGPIPGPPRFPMSAASQLLFGVGSLVIMMIIPFWATFSLPAWAAEHQRDGAPEEEKEDEECEV